MELALPLYVVGPLLVAGVLIMLPEHRIVQRATGLVTVAALVVASAVLVATLAGPGAGTIAHAIGGWLPGVSIVYAADMFSALMMVTTSTLTLLSMWFAAVTGQDDRRFFSPLVLIMLAGVFSALLTADLFNLFVSVEMMLLPAYALIMLSEPDRGRVAKVSASRIYVTVNLLSSTVLLAGVGLIYGVAGTVNLAQLAGSADDAPTLAIGCALVMLALAVKAAAVPLHGWLPRTYPFMSPAITIMFSGLHTKVAIYGLYRLYAVLFDGDATYLWIGLVVACLSMAVGVWGAVGESDARAILSFHMISQIGYILLGLALFTPLALAAGVYYLIHNMLVKASVFFSASAVEEGYGRHPLGAVTGLLRREKPAAVIFLIGALSLAGVPPLTGFVAKLTIVVAAWQAEQYVAVFVAVLVSLFTFQSMMKIWGKTYLGDHKDSDQEILAEVGTTGRRIKAGVLAPAAILAGATIVLGVGAQWLFPLAEQAAASLIDPTSYVKAVLGS